LADLIQIDGETAAVAAAEAITAEGAGSIIRQTWAEAKDEILRAQQMFNTWYGAASSAGGGAWAVLGTSYTAASIARVKPSQIVAGSPYANDSSAVHTWLAYLALRNFYRTAANRKVKDRYDQKFQRYTAEAARVWGALRANGLPVVFRPLEAPGALHAVNAGTWSAANLSAVAGGSGADTAVDVAATWVDQSAYLSPAVKGNAESGPSATATFTVPASNLLQVSIAGLNPPAGVAEPVGIADGMVVPLNATGWNVYAGVAGGALTLQNAVPVPVATKTWTAAGALTANGAGLGGGQYADRNLFFQRTINRA
jgi:hypothetical protein